MNECVLRDLIHGWIETGELPAGRASGVAAHLGPALGSLGWAAQASRLAAFFRGEGRSRLVDGPREGLGAAIDRHRWELADGAAALRLADDLARHEGRSVVELPALVVAGLDGRTLRVPPPPDWAALRVEAVLRLGYAPHVFSHGRARDRLERELAVCCEGLTTSRTIASVRHLLTTGDRFAYGLVRGVPLARNLVPLFAGELGNPAADGGDPLGLAGLEQAWSRFAAADLPPGEARRLFAWVRPDVEATRSPEAVRHLVRQALEARSEAIKRGPAKVFTPFPKTAVSAV